MTSTGSYSIPQIPSTFPLAIVTLSALPPVGLPIGYADMQLCRNADMRVCGYVARYTVIRHVVSSYTVTRHLAAETCFHILCR